jgi:hypothetical protein
MTPLVTCVICAYDYEAYVERAVRSALDQRGLPDDAVEVIVVDDGSTDRTPELLAGFGERIRVIRQSNQGPAVATDRGIAAASGRYVALLDADDEWLPDRLARALDVLEQRPEVGLVHGDMIVVDADEGVRHPSMFAWGHLTVGSGAMLASYLADNQATTSAITLRAELAKRVPAPPAWAWCRDWWIAAHVAATHEIAVLDGPVARYRVHGANAAAFGGEDAERILRLQQRALRVRRILLRTLDLSSATLPQLAGVWNHHVELATRVASARGTTLGAVLPVDDALRAECADRVERARRRAQSDPEGAGRLALAALAADPSAEQAADVFRRALSTAGAAREAPVRTATLADRAKGLDEVAAGLKAADRGDHETSAGHFLAALAHDPGDAHARSALEAAHRRIAGRPPAARDRVARERLTGPRGAALRGARAFVALGDANELAADPSLLRAWAAAFDGTDDATLAIYAPDVDPGTAETQVVNALAAAGLTPEDERDLQLIAVPRTDALEADLAHVAHVRLARDGAPGALAALMRAADTQPLLELARRRWSHDDLGRSLRFAIKICAPHWAGAESWGDVHFARGLADELRRRGHEVLVQVIEEWDDAEGRACDVAVHLRGLDAYVPCDGQLNVLWCISHPELVGPAECDRYDIAYSASGRHATALSQETERPVHVLPQATDPAVFFPDRDARHARELVFVGNSRRVVRPIVRDLLPTDRDLAVWGRDWEGIVDPRHLAGPYLPNDEVRRAYTSAGLVLNDHWDDMRAWGIVSNRVYDVLASGGTLISDELPELHEQLGDTVLTYRTREQLHALVEARLADPGGRARASAAGRAVVLAEHTFARRVETLLTALGARLGTLTTVT